MRNKAWNAGIRLSLLCVGIATTQLVSASDDAAQDWLRKMANAVERLNYVATFVYSNGDALQAMQVDD